MSTLTRQPPRAVSPARRARLRLVSDDGLLRLVRSGDECAFDVLVRRYDAPIFAFCKHMLGSREDAEDVMQETWSAAHRAMVRDDRELTIRAWLYAIARNRCLNAMRSSGPRPTLVPVDVSDEGSGGLYQLPSTHSAADSLADRERFRVLVGDIQELPENQRTALVLHELDALSYDEIAGVLNVSVGAVKSLLVRARVGLTESAEAREVDCDEVRIELAAAVQRIGKLRASSKAHVRRCDDCAQFDRRLKRTGRSLTAAMSPAPVVLLWLQKLGIGKLTGGGSIAAGSAAGGSSSLIGAGGGAFALKAAATVAAAGLATAGAGEVHHLSTSAAHHASHAAPAAVASQRPTAVTPATSHVKSAPSSVPAGQATGRHTALAGVSVRPLEPAAAGTSSSSSKPVLRATHASGGVHVSSLSHPAAPAAGRPEVHQAAPTVGARPTVSQPDPAPTTTSTPVDSTPPPASTTTAPTDPPADASATPSG
jgi:RNA polymerase sigma factor (sigma-70 family)